MPSKAANALICTMRALSKALDDRKLPCILPGFNTKVSCCFGAPHKSHFMVVRQSVMVLGLFCSLSQNSLEYKQFHDLLFGVITKILHVTCIQNPRVLSFAGLLSRMASPRRFLTFKLQAQASWAQRKRG